MNKYNSEELLVIFIYIWSGAQITVKYFHVSDL